MQAAAVAVVVGSGSPHVGLPLRPRLHCWFLVTAMIGEQHWLHQVAKGRRENAKSLEFDKAFPIGIFFIIRSIILVEFRNNVGFSSHIAIKNDLITKKLTRNSIEKKYLTEKENA